MIRQAFLIVIVSLQLGQTMAFAQEIGFVEDFALAADRQKVLNQLVPGTEDYYYYSALYHQSLGEFDQVDKILEKWIRDHKETARVRIIQNRQALLRFESNSEATYEYLQSRLNLNFNHQREIPTTERNLPTELDEELISVKRLSGLALSRHKDLSGFTNVGLEYIAGTALNDRQRRNLLKRLIYPDYPNLVEVIVDYLQDPRRSFNEFPIQRNLTIRQLESCLASLPRLINDQSFVNAYLAKLHPGNDVNWRSNPKEHREYLDRLYKFSTRLNPVFNSLKACVLYRLLELDRQEGIYNRDLFFEYLKLPRDIYYVNRDIIPTDRRQQSHIARLNANFESSIRLRPVLNDYDLVFDYLNRFLVNAANYDAFAPYIKDNVLDDIFATVKLLNDKGDKERWAARLSQSQFNKLKDRVDLEFAPTNSKYFADDQMVSVDLFVKNVDSLIVKVYEINELNYYRKYQREIDTDIQLDGLVPNSEKSYSYDEDPLHRKPRTFEFKELTQNGVYVIDFIGAGKSSRALIRRGRLSAVSKTTVAGQLLHVFDHRNKSVSGAEIWVAGNRYTAEEDGSVLIPFSNNPGRQLAIISANGFSSLQSIEQTRENYQLMAGIYVDRESLLSNQKSEVLIRPALRVTGHPSSVKLLKNVSLTISSINQNDVSATKQIDGLELNDDAETICEFLVPPRLKQITFKLSANVENISQNQEQNLSYSRTFYVNQVDASDEIQDVHLLPTDAGFMLEVRGKTGEIRKEQSARIELLHRGFKDPVYVDLESDEQGQIRLGALNGITRIGVTIIGGSKRSWTIHNEKTMLQNRVAALAGDDILLAAPEGVTQIAKNQVSLLEVRRGQYVADHFEKITLQGGKVVLSDLKPGDYLLRYKSLNQNVSVSVSDGDVEFGVVLGQHRRSELRDLSPLVFEELKETPENIEIKLDNANKMTRVHVIASRYQPRYDSYGAMANVRDILPWQQDISIRHSAYLAGRSLSDEYQYILNRRYEKKYPGNMLNRPGMLINPWSIRDTQNNVESLATGDEFGDVGTDADSLAQRSEGKAEGSHSNSDFSNLNFLSDQSKLMANLRPDENGVIRISRDKLAGLQHIRFIAIDPVSTIERDVNLAPDTVELRDLRLSNGLKPDSHFAQSKQTEVLTKGQTLTIQDLISGRFHYFDDIGDVFRLYLALNPNTKLNDFQFLLNWSEKTAQEKQKLYSKYACHELNFYLFKKDAEFFDKVVRPHVAFKSEQGFIDHFLTRQSVKKFVDEQWSYDKLNVVERILLAQRSENHSADIVRNIEDLYFLKPIKREYFDSLYDRSIRTGELNFESSLRRNVEGLDRLKQPLPGLVSNAPKAATARRAIAPSNSVAPPASGGLGGFGGGGGGRAGRGRVAGQSLDDQLKEVADKRQFKEMEKLAELDGKVLALEEAEAADDMLGGKFSKKRNSNRNGYQQLQQQIKGDFAVDSFYLGANQKLGELRRKGKSLYRRLPATKEWIEQQYYQLPMDRQKSDLVQSNRFWKDYSNHTGGDFLSPYFTESHRSLTEMMFALAVLDLPEKAPEHEFDYADNSMKLTAGGTMIAMHQQFTPVVFQPRNTSVLISENFFQKNDRYRQEDGVQYDKFVSEQFFAHTLYGAQVVVTNPTSTPQAIDLLVQIPRGSVATSGSQETRSMQIQLNAFSTKTFEYYFYFPTAGEFSHYPAHVSREDEVLAVSDNVEFNVVDRPVEIDKTSWAYVSQNGSNDDVIEFLRTRNVLQLAMEKIAFRMKDRDFFRRAINTLKSRYRYNHVLWSYGIKHEDDDAAREFLLHEPRVFNHVGKYFESELLKIDPYQRNWYQHREYSPLVNARAHKVNAKRQILNPALHSQYHQLLEILANRKSLTSNDHLVITYYMLLQDRIDEAVDHFGKVKVEDLNEKIQFDYCDAYLDFYLENPESAANKAKRWVDYPVDLWRNRFANILAQVDEIRGSKTSVVDNRDDQQQQTKLASETAAFDFEVESGKVRISAQAVDGIDINYYEMDIEHMFSNSPFELKNLDRFSVIKPSASESVGKTGDFDTAIDIPGGFANRNVLVEVRAGDQVKAKPYFAHNMSLQTIERFGQLQVTSLDAKKPIAKAYVKVYSQRNNGQIKFHKDGYTDLRGRFDYVSQSNNPLDGITKYSILVLSPEHGAVTRQVDPPAE